MKKLKILSSLAALLLAFQVHAQTNDTPQSRTYPDTSPPVSRYESHPHIGIFAGVANPTGDNRLNNTEKEYGAEVGFQPWGPFGLAIEGSRTDMPITGGTTNQRTVVLAKGAYHFGGTTFLIKDSYLGVAAGTIFRGSENEATVGPTAGFDIPLARDAEDARFSIGANAKYLYTDRKGEPEVGSINGVLKLWF